MKAKIHPEYHNKVTVTCSCGNSFETGSTESEITVEVCSACHPFYTGKKKLVDTAGRVDKFQQKLKTAQERRNTAKKKKSSSKKEKVKDDTTVKLG